MSDAIELMKLRWPWKTGQTQQDRMIKDKYWSFQHALLHSYQAAKISKLNDEKEIRALINPNKLKPDYDDKIISVDFEHGFKIGDIFNWNNTDTKWIIYLQDLTELAYFRGDIRKCNYQIKWKDGYDENGEPIIKSTYAAVRGPVETKINFIQKKGISIDTPNHSLSIVMPGNKDTISYFKRYSKFYLNEDKSICWRVEGFDSISTPGILEIIAIEYYANEDSDDKEEGVADGLITEPIPPVPSDEQIKGEVFIKPQKTYKYEYVGNENKEWEFESNSPLPLEYEINNKVITIKWTKTYTGQFTLKYGEARKTIVIESLF